MKEVTAGIGGLILRNSYGGYYEAVVFAGMPSKDAFSIVYQTAYVEPNPKCKSVAPHACDGSIENVQTRIQLFYPMDTKKISLPGRKKIEFQVVIKIGYS